LDTLFIQFYSKIDRMLSFELGNGFSDTYDLCKSKGDFIWMDHVHDYLDKIEYSSEFPISKGTAYISVSYLSQLYRVLVWAKRYPDVKFIAGGPVVTTGLVTDYETPNNMIITKKSVEEWFGVENFSGRWNLDIPSTIKDDELINFSYTIDNMCYWRKCTFCTFTESRHVPRVRERKNIKCEFQDIKRKGSMIIRLGTEALGPNKISHVVKALPYNEKRPYRSFLRPSLPELNALKNIKEDLSIIKFRMGVELPGNRMWKLMRKGFREEVVLEILNVLHKANSKFFFSMVLGWNNLISSDIKALENFMKSVPGSEGCGVTIHRLFAFPGTDVFKTHEVDRDYYSGPFYLGYTPKLKKEQLELNKKAKEIIIHYTEEKKMHFTDLCDLEDVDV